LTEEIFAKVFFYYDTDGGSRAESVWAVEVSPLSYEIRNCPWHVSNITFGDVVECYRDDEGILIAARLVKDGGHRNILVEFTPKDEEFAEQFLKELNDLGCTYECFKKYSLYALNIPPEVQLGVIIEFLSQARTEQKILFELLKPSSL